MFFIELKLIELHTLQFDSHVQVRVDQAAVQDCGVRNSIALEGCTLTSQLVLVTLRAQQRVSALTPWAGFARPGGLGYAQKLH